MALKVFDPRAGGSGSGDVLLSAADTWANVRNAATGSAITT